MEKINLKEVTVATWVRTALLIIALLNQVLVVFGVHVIDVNNPALQDSLSTLFTIIIALVNWWKNNSFTLHAQRADKVSKSIKMKDKSEEQVVELENPEEHSVG